MNAGFRVHRVIAGLALLAALAGVAAAQDATEPAGRPELVAARLSSTPERARLVVDLSGAANFSFFSTDEPKRIVIDIEAGAVGFDPTEHEARDGLVEDYRIGPIDAELARSVLILSGPARVQQAYMLDAVGDQPARLVVDVVPDSEEGFAARVAAVRETGVETEPPAPSGPEVVQPETPAEPGAPRPLIVIDPGHGGIDGGARAANGELEKTIVLRLGLDLQEYLVGTGKFDVALTRDSDVFLTLEQRVELARSNRADLMLSLHADSFDQPFVRGAAVYTRDENATDVLDKVLAEHENKVDLIAGFSPPQADDAVVDILVDLMRRESRRQAYRAASAIVAALDDEVTMRRFPLRQADFFVLQAPEVPSILVELGFLSNPDDSSNLTDEAWRREVAQAVARGIEDYFDSVE